MRSSHVRKVCYREKGVLVEDITLDESLQQFPRHRAAELETTEYDKRPAASMILDIHSYEMKKKAASPTGSLEARETRRIQRAVVGNEIRIVFDT